MSASKTIRVLIVDDHFATRLGLAMPVNNEPDMEVVGEAGTGSLALDLYRRLTPDVVLMDYQLPDMSGVMTLSALRASHPDAQVILLTILDGEEDVFRAVEAGARGYLTKSCECEDVLRAIRQVAAGGKFFPSEIAAKVEARKKRSPLSDRELEILRLLVRGHSTKEIVDILQLSMGTIRLHISLILSKLGAYDRTNAVAIAIERGIVHVGE